MNYIDLFAGAGGLSEGFIRAGFNPIAHVEMNKDACDTLKTRTSFHYLKDENRIEEYYDYLKQKISREELWSKIPEDLIKSVKILKKNKNVADGICSVCKYNLPIQRAFKINKKNYGRNYRYGKTIRWHLRG